ncbi:DapH/DapD/GlmU-related protein [Clostridium perfringens]|nr:acetyltransferase [Clostridium perfringens]MDK0529834.1 DapH/DapD/GlmU-related protein [Clostridium perfringens]MDK0724206.1 DapH/DapD/GlmU-related protein [Clostridium perfringens]MDU4419933.1 DapH/DapD/GlmU-related protein [Clostridium perfringens]MDU7458952.1 DapH/DapD/GlmU-related protein [Clostridium perfringens]
MKNKYSFSETLKNIYSLVLTKIFFKRARLIRRPFYCRGKKWLEIDEGFTTGYACRFDILGNENDNLKKLIFGKNCCIGDYVHIVASERVSIGSNVLMASKIFISDTNHGEYSGDKQSDPNIPPNERLLIAKPVKIGDNVWIGDNVVVLPGVSIGSGSIIGANSTVNKNIPQNCIAVGSPAKVVKKYDKKDRKWIRKEND